MEEAGRLCDRVALIDRGRVAALETRAGLAARAAFGQIVRNEVRLALRRPAGLIGGVARPVAPLLVLAAYAVVFGYLARRFFRWE